MTKSILICLLALSSVPAFAAKRVTVEQLSHEIASSSKKKDAKVADRLNNLQLTERLSAAKLAAFDLAQTLVPWQWRFKVRSIAMSGPIAAAGPGLSCAKV